MLNEGASSKVIRGSLLECEEIVESDHKGLLNEFGGRVEVIRRKLKAVMFKRNKSLN